MSQHSQHAQASLRTSTRVRQQAQHAQRSVFALRAVERPCKCSRHSSTWRVWRVPTTRARLTRHLSGSDSSCRPVLMVQVALMALRVLNVPKELKVLMPLVL